MEANGRVADYEIDPLFLHRWSPRAFTSEEISSEQLLGLFEAARWAPSAFNAQPWRFVYARRGTPRWDAFLDLLLPGNQSWAKDAAALIFIFSNGLAPSGSPSRTHAFDTGAAWASFALQATKSGWHVHGMAGFDAERAPGVLGAPNGAHVQCAVAIGKRGDKSLLPERLQERETPSQRHAVTAFAFEGGFPAP